MYELNRITISGFVTGKKGENALAVRKLDENEKASVVTFDIVQNKYKGKDEKPEKKYFHCMGLGSVAQRLMKGSIKYGTHLIIDGKLDVSTKEKDGKKYVNVTILIDDFSYVPNASNASTPEAENK